MDERNESSQDIVVHDPIHSSIALPPIAWKVIDTPIFQRLRDIKQTGNTHYVYPGAEHTRFQHSIGVGYLALQLGRTIKLRHPDLITDHQIKLLCIAGLCHDLGHCAFSHLYDGHIIPLFKRLGIGCPGENKGIQTHEEASYLLLLKIWKDDIPLIRDLEEEDVRTIGKMILGAPSKVPEPLRDDLEWTDNDRRHSFLFEVVSNDATGIDVDKFDYLKRDSHYTGVPCPFDPQRLMAFFTVTETDGEYHLDYMPKAGEMIHSMWDSRDALHRRVYQHRVVKCIDLMTIEMIMLCKDAEFNGVPLRQAHCDIDQYCKLTDHSIIALVATVPEAKVLLDRIYRRDLWTTIAIVSSPDRLGWTLDQLYDNVRVSECRFQKEYVYYVYHTQDTPLDPQFFMHLIMQANGCEINIRTKSQTIKEMLSE